MAAPLTINVTQAPVEAPISYVVPATIEMEPLSIFAHFDGSGVAVAFRPAIGIYSGSGLLLARVFPQASVAAGGEADVTFAPFLRQEADAAAGTEPAWAIIDTTSGESIGANTTMTFTFASNNFNTNDPATFSLRPAAPPFQGIAILKTGVYDVVWFVQASRATTANPETQQMQITPGSSFTDTFVNDVDLTAATAYGTVLQGSAGPEGDWAMQYRALVGISSVTGARYLTCGCRNRGALAITNRADARITVKRLGAPLADFSNFF